MRSCCLKLCALPFWDNKYLPDDCIKALSCEHTFWMIFKWSTLSADKIACKLMQTNAKLAFSRYQIFATLTNLIWKKNLNKTGLPSQIVTVTMEFNNLMLQIVHGILMHTYFVSIFYIWFFSALSLFSIFRLKNDIQDRQSNIQSKNNDIKFHNFVNFLVNKINAH